MYTCRFSCAYQNCKNSLPGRKVTSRNQGSKLFSSPTWEDLEKVFFLLLAHYFVVPVTLFQWGAPSDRDAWSHSSIEFWLPVPVLFVPFKHPCPSFGIPDISHNYSLFFFRCWIRNPSTQNSVYTRFPTEPDCRHPN